MEKQIMGLFVEGGEVPVPIRGVGVEIELSGMFAHSQIAQRYRNESDETIEAIYAFPLPTEGVLLGMEIDISGKKLNGSVQSNNQARDTYEDAVTGGNGAFLLRQLSNGLYQMNVGNLKPGEEAEIRIRYGEILRWSGNTLRYRLPTVVAPHYGDPGSAGISREDVPKTTLLAEYPLTLKMTIKGDLARAEMSSPSHAVEIERGESSTLVRLSKDARLDRDFILTFGMDAPSVWEVLTAPDGDRFVALGCLNVPTLGASNKTEARDITIVVDCSGSMSGDSIAQARSALLAILDELNDGDSISILRFGSTMDVWTRRPVILNKQTRERLHSKVSALEADLGGTEIMQAIGKAVGISKPGADILLITDGEAYVDQGELNKIASTSHRFFTVGVGSAVSETVVKTLADVSGGACELVTPNEHMASRIVAHARRMTMPRAHLRIDWCANEYERVGDRNVVFAGDTLPVMAVLDGLPTGSSTATLETEEGSITHETPPQIAEGALAEALPRIVAWYRLNEEISEAAAAEIAVRYQLVTRHTSMVAVLECTQDEKTDGLPTLAEVPQMLAAGWGGLGAIDTIRCSMADAFFEPRLSSISFNEVEGKSHDRDDIPAFYREKRDGDTSETLCSPGMYLLLWRIQMRGLDEITGDFLHSLEDPRFFVEAAQVELSQEIHEWLENLIQSRQDMGIGEIRRMTVLAFIAGLLDLIDADKKRRFRALRRAVQKEISLHPIPDELYIQVADELKILAM